MNDWITAIGIQPVTNNTLVNVKYHYEKDNIYKEDLAININWNDSLLSHWRIAKEKIVEKDDWIKYDGKGCPVSNDVIIDLKTSCGIVFKGIRPANSQNEFWLASDSGTYITHYRISEKNKDKPKFIIKESTISGYNKWVLHNGESQPIADDVIISYVYRNNSHVHYTALAKNIDWTTKEGGGILYWKIVKVNDTKPDNNGWIKYDGLGCPVYHGVKIDVKWDNIGAMHLAVDPKEVYWPYIAHYRLSTIIDNKNLTLYDIFKNHSTYKNNKLLLNTIEIISKYLQDNK